MFAQALSARLFHPCARRQLPVLLGLLLTWGLMACSGSRGDGLGTSLGSATTDDAGADAEPQASGCVDADGDGYGVDCAAGADCDDTDAARFVEQGAFVDADEDGYGEVPARLCVADEGSVPAGYALVGGDCDDARKDVNPDQEIDGCDDVDTDCDDRVDEDLVPVATRCGIGACQRSGQSTCTNRGAVDDCEPGSPISVRDATCDGIDDDCDGAMDEDHPVAPSSCTLGTCQATGELRCMHGALVDTCRARTPSNMDSTCDGIDDDCDGSLDEDFAPQTTACGVGVCARGGATRCEAGRTLDSCQPGPAAASDATCDRRDDDCDGDTDEEYAATTTQCGSGVCHHQGQTSCVNGSVVDSCQAGAGGAADTSCDGVDDDCDGRLDEDFAGKAESCGQGACARQTITRCERGTEVSTCTPGAATADNNCNGIDEDCDGAPDDRYAPRTVSCGVGMCQRSGATACVDGAEHNTCTPGTATGDDHDCNGQDDNCDGRVDEGYVPTRTNCGVGACAAQGTLQCVGGRVLNTCAQGQAGNDAVCDGIDNDCNAQIDEDYASVSESCGIGVCRRTMQTSCVGGHETRCAPGPTTGPDNDCDGIDDDCNGIADDAYVGHSTACGVGACSASGATSCVGGREVDSCRPGAPAAVDNTCNNVDEDCSGVADEDYRVAIACGVGACTRDGVETCSAGRPVRSCAPGAPASDANCNGVDDDCNGQSDDSYQARATRCGVGACQREGQTACMNGREVDLCSAGRPTGADDNCNGVDEDCDGMADDHYPAAGTRCGRGECTTTGSTSCVQGRVVDSCVPRAPAANIDATCNGRDDDCDGNVDEEYPSRAIACGQGPCRNSVQSSCVNGVEQLGCAPLPPAANDASCNAVDDDCNGRIDDGYPGGATRCGTGQCTATGTLSCQNGLVADSCVPPEDACAPVPAYCGPTKQDACTGRTRCTNQACNCGGVPECTVFRAIQGSDSKYVYYGRDTCGALCQPVLRCSHASSQCNGTAEACGVDLITNERCECAPAACDPKLSLCIKGQRCGTNACQGPCGTCTNTCGEQRMCDAAGRSSCPADCGGNICASTATPCTPCQAGCNRTTGLCNRVLQVPGTPITGVLTN
jgi:hypothetical protein